jgi:hypothetical protein
VTKFRQYYDLTVCSDALTGTWSIYGDYDVDFVDPEGEEITSLSWEVPEWTNLKSEAQAREIVRQYQDGTLPDHLMPAHPDEHDRSRRSV